MGKATKKSHTKKSQDPGTDVSPSTSGTVDQKAKSHRKPKTPTKKNGDEFSFCCRNPNKVHKTIKKGKKTPPPRALKRKASEKTVKKTKNVARKAMYGHYQDLVEELASTEPEPDHISLGSSSASITDRESQ
ncbi:hypothetical protein LTLLF_167425 [Microtus ochrogaster]|uniref:Uncharacterized protein n=1 Tax=Microtus ochrogaster TaxID=79684 RepID=A0A8J6KYG9_MICOH|nr:hypothetical protein LTLLF_167425 [Microtus ochrogaster]